MRSYHKRMYEECSERNFQQEGDEYSKKCSLTTIVCLHILIFFQYLDAFVIQEDDSAIIRIKNYYCLLEESKEDLKCFDTYFNIVKEYVLKKDSSQSVIFPKPLHEQETQFWFFKTSYVYWKKRGFEVLLKEKPVPDYLEFEDLAELIECLLNATFPNHGLLDAFHDYKNFSDTMEKEKGLSISELLEGLISLQILFISRLPRGTRRLGVECSIL